MTDGQTDGRTDGQTDGHPDDGKDARSILLSRVKSDVADVMSPGSAFQNLAAITGKARSPSVECRVTGTTKAALDAERSFCLERRSDTLITSLEVVRTKTVETTIRQDAQFELHAFRNGQPVKSL